MTLQDSYGYLLGVAQNVKGYAADLHRACPYLFV